MIRSAVTIALVPQLKTGPWIFWENLEAGISKAAQLGFDAVELFTPSANAIDPALLRSLLGSYNLSLSAVGTGAGKVLNGLTLTDSDPEVRKQAVAFITGMIEFGGRFHAPAIIGSMQGNVGAGIEREKALEWLAEGLVTLAMHAEREGVPLIYEPLNRYETNVFNTMETGAGFIERLQTGNIKLLADLFHMNIEEVSIPETIRKVGRSIGYVHFADSNRRPVGMGHTSIPEISAALTQIGYSGYVSAEAFPWPNPDEAAQQTIWAFNQFFKTAASS